MGRPKRLAANSDDGKRERDLWWRAVDCGRALSVDAVEVRMPAAVSGTAAIHPAPRRFPPRRKRLASAWNSTRRLLCRLLLGFDAAAFRGRRDRKSTRLN